MSQDQGTYISSCNEASQTDISPPAFLSTALQSLYSKPALLTAVKETVRSTNNAFFSAILKSDTVNIRSIPYTPTPQPSLTDPKVRQAKVEEISRAKVDLAARIAALERLEHSVDTSPHKQSYKYYVENKEELSKKQKEAFEFVNRLSAERKERIRRQQEHIRKIMKAVETQMQQEHLTLKEKKEAERKKRKEELLRSFQEKRERRMEELKKLEEHSKRLGVLPETEYMHKKLEDKYKADVLLPLLEKQKMELAKRRNLVKPVTKEEIHEHMRKHELIVNRKEEERKRQLSAKRREEMLVMLDQKRFKSLISKELSEKEAKSKAEALQKAEEKKLIREKMLKYADLVKELHPMRASSRKSAELKHLIEQLRHPVREKRDVKQDYEISKVVPSRGIRSINPEVASSYVEGKIQKRKSHGPRKITDSLEFSIRQHTEVRIPRKKIDYLDEFRKNRDLSVSGDKRSLRYNWKNDLNNKSLNEVEKINRVVAKAGMLEQRAKMEEKVMRAAGLQGNVALGEQVSDMLIDAIKAKLAVLEKL